MANQLNHIQNEHLPMPAGWQLRNGAGSVGGVPVGRAANGVQGAEARADEDHNPWHNDFFQR